MVFFRFLELFHLTTMFVSNLEELIFSKFWCLTEETFLSTKTTHFNLNASTPTLAKLSQLPQDLAELTDVDPSSMTSGSLLETETPLPTPTCKYPSVLTELVLVSITTKF